MSDSCSVNTLCSSGRIKRKRICLSIATKLQIVERVENGESISKLASEYNIGNQTVRDLIRKKDELYRFFISSNTLDPAGSRKTVKASKFDDLDKAVFEWFKKEKAKGHQITGPVLLEKARRLHSEMKIPASFSASQGWLHCFKTRHGIRQWDIQGDSSATSLCLSEINKLLESGDLTFDQIYNISATALYWKPLPPKALMISPGQRQTNERLTVLACSNANGSHKLKLVCIGRYKNRRSFREIQIGHFRVLYYGWHKARMSWEVLKEWFFKHFVPEVREHLSSKNQPEKAILFLGPAFVSPNERGLKTSDGQIYVYHLFPQGAHLKQPLDGCLTEFKRLYRKSLLGSVLEENPTLGEFNMRWTIRDAILSCLKCWEELPVSVIQKSWSSLFPDARKSIKVKESPDETQETAITSLWESARRIRGFEDVKKEDIEEWLLSDSDGGNENYKNAEEDERPEREDVAATEEELAEESYGQVEGKPEKGRVSIKEALKCAETLLEFLDQEPDSHFSQILTLRELSKSLMQKLCKDDTRRHQLSEFFKENT